MVSFIRKFMRLINFKNQSAVLLNSVIVCTCEMHYRFVGIL